MAVGRIGSRHLYKLGKLGSLKIKIMKIIQKIFKWFFYFFLLLIITIPFWISKVPLEHISFLVGQTPVVDKYLCEYEVKVSGDSMSPLIEPGTTIKLNRCFDEGDLTEGIVVLFGKDGEYHLGVIRHILPLDPVIYKISNERPNERLQDMVLTEITAISTEIDTSRSSYQFNESIESLVLDPTDYVSDLYLGKIPRGVGIEMAEVEKTDSFIRAEDKFCMVVVPKKELAFVDIEIINAQSKEIIKSHKKIVFNVLPKPNTNCQDFGDQPGMIDLPQGNYRYRFLLNHQALADIPFTVE